jgi:hypothetical protein
MCCFQYSSLVLYDSIQLSGPQVHIFDWLICAVPVHFFTFKILFPMHRNWFILDWNVRGINSQGRWDDLSNKTSESNCNIICLEETKRETFDSTYLRNFCPRRLNQFIFSPSVGNSGGLITIWNSLVFSGRLISQSFFSDYHGVYLYFLFTKNLYHQYICSLF